MLGWHAKLGSQAQKKCKASGRLGGRHIASAGQDNAEPLGSVHFNAVYGELRAPPRAL